MKLKTTHCVWLAVLLVAAISPQKLFGHGKQIEAGGGGGGPVTLTKAQQESIGLQTDKADFHSIDTILLLNGSVKIDPDRHAHVTTRISGRVEQLFARVGDRVEKGQKLAAIQSRQLGEPPPTVEVIAPVSGVVNERGVSLGDAIEPNTELFHIVDLSKVIVIAQVYEEDAAKVKREQTARIAALSYPTNESTGTITFVGLELDPERRTLPVWFAVDNPDGKLRADMFVKAAVVLATNSDVLTVPKSAVMSDGGEKFVFVRTGDTFNRVDVQTGAEDDRNVEIKDGLVPGDEVVVQGQREIFTAWLTGGKKPAADKD
ncbi:MAG: efflux RND transporter periplasmic adaptor subunit [Verrucomicrobia bacterium]|nr:efflux RND transporter periplasmic adaptor subunit [Verrucomicrobiota bacterium]